MEDVHMQAITQMVATAVSQVADNLSQQTQMYLGQQNQILMEHLSGLQATREGRIEGAKMPTFSGKPHEVVAAFFYDVGLFLTAKGVDLTRPEIQSRLVAMIAANLRGGAASWYYGRVAIDNNPIFTVAELQAAMDAEFTPSDQQQRVRAALKGCRQTHDVDEYVARFRKIMAQVRDMSQLDKVDRFVDGLKPDTQKEVNYMQCATLSDAIRCAQAYERTHFRQGSSRRNHGSDSRPRQPPAAWNRAEPMDISAMDTRNVPKAVCKQEGLCFYCKKPGHRIRDCPTRPANQRSAGNDAARRT